MEIAHILFHTSDEYHSQLSREAEGNGFANLFSRQDRRDQACTFMLLHHCCGYHISHHLLCSCSHPLQDLESIMKASRQLQDSKGMRGVLEVSGTTSGCVVGVVPQVGVLGCGNTSGCVVH